MNRPHLGLMFFAGLLITSLVPGPAYSQENEWYQVELWVFAHENSSALDDEYWQPSLEPTLSERSQQLSDNPDLPLGKHPQSELDAAVTDNLRKTTEYRLLFQERWLQKVESRDNAVPIRIEGGRQLQEGLSELSGEIQLDRGRYLHLRTNLYFSQVPDGWTEVTYRIADEPKEIVDEPSTFSLFAPLVSEPEEVLTVAMQQNRRMRSGELHYVDHPLFGLLIRLTPYEAAEQEQPQP